MYPPGYFLERWPISSHLLSDRDGAYAIEALELRDYRTASKQWPPVYLDGDTDFLLPILRPIGIPYINLICDVYEELHRAGNQNPNSPPLLI